MSEWLGKPRLTLEDIKKAQPSVSEYFPMLTRYYVDDQKMRLVVVLSHEAADKFKKAVTDTFGSFIPTNMKKAAVEAIDAWIKNHS
jgi:hypothetical protein